MNELLEQALFAFLSNDGAINPLVWDTTAASARIYPQKAPQNAPGPRLQYHQSGRELPRALSGCVSPVTARVRLDCYADAYADAKTLAEAVRNAFANFGVSGWMDAVYVQHAVLADGGDDDQSLPVHGDETGSPSVSLEAVIRFEIP